MKLIFYPKKRINLKVKASSRTHRLCLMHITQYMEDTIVWYLKAMEMKFQVLFIR